MERITKTLTLATLAAALALPPSAEAARRVKKAKPAKAQTQDLAKAGMALIEKGDFNGAIEALSKATRADRGDGGAFFLLGYAHYQRGFKGRTSENADKNDAMAAIGAYSAALAVDPKLGAVSAPYKLYHSLALCYEAVGAFDKAIENYRSAFQLAPHNPMLPLYAARLRYKLDDPEKAAANLAISLRKAKAQGQERRVLELLRTDPFFSPMLASPLTQRVVAHYDPQLIASLTVDNGEMRDAVRDVPPDQRQAILVEKPEESPVLKQLATADEEFRFRRFRDAADAYNECLRLNQQAGVLTAAQLTVIYERLGASYLRLGLTDGAIRALQYAIQQNPFNAAAHYHLALSYSVSGNFNNSLKSLGEAFRTAPSEGELKKLMLLAKTDAELDPLRDMAAFSRTLEPFRERLAQR